MKVRWLAFGLTLLAMAAYAAPAPKDEQAEKPATATEIEKPNTEKPNTEKPKKAAKPAAKKADPKPAADQPKTTTVDRLPGALKKLHVCAMPKSQVEIDSERYAKSVVFFISCPAARGALTPTAVYVARDTKGTGAKRLMFEALTANGGPAKLETLYSVTPAREAFTKAGDPLPNRNANNETPWLVGAWKPDDRPDVCAVAAQWRLQGDKGELYLWEEAKECPKGELPKYESKADKKPPPLVGR